MKSILRTFLWWWRREHKEAELQDELQFHLDEEANDRRAAGSSDTEARRAARLDLGNPLALREQVRVQWGWTWIEQFGQDLGYAFRVMRANRVFTALTVLSLALGIGANTAIYSFMDAVMMRLLPVKDPGSLVVVNWRSREPTRDANGDRESVMHAMSGSVNSDGEGGLRSGIFPFPAFELLQKHSDTVFSSLFAYYPNRGVNLLIDGHADVGRGEYVSGDYFQGLAVHPAAGRLLGPADDREGAPPAVVVSLAFSQHHFGGADRAPGRAMLVNGVSFTIAGVTPSDFFGVDPSAAPDFYLPLHTNLLVDAAGLNAATKDMYLEDGYYWLEMMGRLRPGVSREEAQAALAPAFHHWATTTAHKKEELTSLPELQLVSGATGIDTLRREYSKPLFMLLMLVGLILTLACANTANLLLARSEARTREMAVRLSLGAGRLRVIRQLLTESVLLALIGGSLGVILAAWGIRVLTLLLANEPGAVAMRVGLNWHVLLATLAVSVTCGIVFGLAPAIQSTRPDVMPALKEVRIASAGSRRRFRWLSAGRTLVMSQIAIALVLLVTAGLFVRTLSNLYSVRLGFNAQGVLLFDINARQAGHQDAEIATYYANLHTALSNMPGVASGTLSGASIISAGRQLPILVAGREARGTRFLNVGPGFFTTMEIPMLLGREIDRRDRAHTASVVVVNERFATVNFGSANPLGRHITLGGPAPRDMEIVGVSANVRYQGVKEEFTPVVFVAYPQGDWPPLEGMTFALRTNGDPLTYANSVREIVRRADPRVPVTNVRTQSGEIDQTINQEVVFARLCTAFAVLALLMATVGLYGTTAYGVARRTGELGIRAALGATRRAVVALVLRDVILQIAGGLMIGVPLALAVSRFVDSFLFGLKPTDPVALVIAVIVLAATALLAGYVPARRAALIDPMRALRHE
jgi:predicted permease